MRKLTESLVVLLFLCLGLISLPAYSQEETTETETETGTAVEKVEDGDDGETDIEGEGDDDLTAADVEDDFAEEIELKKQEAVMHFENATAARETRNFELAVSELEQAVELDPDNVDYGDQLKVVRTQYVTELLKAAQIQNF